MKDATKAEALQAELAEAFAERTCPDEAVLRGGCPGDDRDGARRWLRNRPWQDVLGDELRGEYRDYTCFLTPEGWVYYFPALAVLALDLDDLTELHDALMVRLTWHPDDIAPLLSTHERRAVIRWMEYMAEQYEEREWENSARYALETHWTAEPES